ncbi:b(0,+)-type amino acid transporter 1-like isoform X2 [Lycorma delicatula]|uniref:b(0,+)-type amino acid transporter 1-like isoform X2 n=1 Tax=Lycorma delicatula TaxID=130591 RepID=UPI003F514496
MRNLLLACFGQSNGKNEGSGNKNELPTKTETTTNGVPKRSSSTSSSLSNSSKNVQLQRELGLFSAISLIVSVMIGSGIFVSPSSALKHSGSVGLSLVVWAVCGLISLLGALSFSELSTVVPRSGAEYSYFRAAFSKHHKFFGPLPSFLYVWVVVLILRPAEVAIVILTFTEYVYTPLTVIFDVELITQHGLLLKKILSVMTLCVITYINYSSVKLFVRLQNIFSSFKILACIVVIVGGAYSLTCGNVHNLNRGFEGSSTSLRDLVLAFYSGLWAYDGWSSVTVVAEEIKNPEKNIFRSIVIGVPLVTGLYFFMNVAYMTVLTIPEMVSVPAVAVAFGEKVMGKFAIIIPFGVALSTFSCSLSVQFGVSRLCFAAGREGHMVEAFSYIHIRRLTPAPAVILQGLLTVIFLLAGDITTLIEFASFLIWIFYGLAMVALIVLRRTKPLARRPYKVPIIIPICLATLSLVLASVPIVFHPQMQYIGAVAFIAFGICVYYPFVYLKKRLPFMDKFTWLIQVLLEVVPPPKDMSDPNVPETTTVHLNPDASPITITTVAS